MGHPRSPIGIGNDSGDEFEAGNDSTDNAYIWTYTSPEFPMAQVSLTIHIRVAFIPFSNRKDWEVVKGRRKRERLRQLHLCVL